MLAGCKMKGHLVKCLVYKHVRIWVQVPTTNIKAGCVNKHQESQFIAKGVKGGGRNKQEDSLEFTHQLVLLNWWAVDLVRDSVSKNTVGSEEDISFAGFTTYLKMYTFTHTFSWAHIHVCIYMPLCTAHPTLTVSWVWRREPCNPALWRLRQKDHDF